MTTKQVPGLSTKSTKPAGGSILNLIAEIAADRGLTAEAVAALPCLRPGRETRERTKKPRRAKANQQPARDQLEADAAETLIGVEKMDPESARAILGLKSAYEPLPRRFQRARILNRKSRDRRPRRLTLVLPKVLYEAAKEIETFPYIEVVEAHDVPTGEPEI